MGVPRFRSKAAALRSPAPIGHYLTAGVASNLRHRLRRELRDAATRLFARCRFAISVSVELDKVERRQRPAGKLDELAADGERTKIDAEETEAFDQGSDI